MKDIEPKRLAAVLIRAVIAALLAAKLFYDSVFGLIPGALFGMYVLRRGIMDEKERRKRELLSEFRTLLTAISSAMSSGTSLENAFMSVHKDMADMYPEKSVVMKELKKLRGRLGVGESVAAALRAWASEYKSEEIADFAAVIATISGSGGNTIRTIKKAAENISTSIEIKEEIGVSIAAKKLEARIMTVMPFAMILYIRTANPGYLDPVYGNIGGILIMTAAVIFICLSDILGSRIVNPVRRRI